MNKIKKACIDEIRRRLFDKGGIKSMEYREILLTLKHLNDTLRTESEVRIGKLKEKQLKVAIEALTQQIEDTLEGVTLTGQDALLWRLNTTLQDIKRIGSVDDLKGEGEECEKEQEEEEA